MERYREGNQQDVAVAVKTNTDSERVTPAAFYLR